MKRYVVTGAPGAGKTAIIRQLELDGFSIVEETATDIIALSQARGIPEPWTRPEFIDAIVNGSKPPVTAEEGYLLSRLLDGIYESAKTGKQLDFRK